MWRNEKTEEGQDIVWDGVESGIAPSPLKGTANIQNANISTEMGEIMASFGRTAQQQASITDGTLTPDGATLFNAPASLKAGTWIRVSASTVTSISAATSPSSVSVDYLIVGGGGAGGSANDNPGAGGGGGAGEYKAGTTSLSVGNFDVVVGRGGIVSSASAIAAGPSGSSSSFETIGTSIGGGGGGYGIDNVSPATSLNGTNGASGGGGGAGGVGYQGTGGTGTAGNNGGAGHENATVNNRAGGGGGGSAGAGTAGSSATGGAGGAGTSNSITGTAVFYAAGGGGGSVGTAGAGGSSGAGGDGGDAAPGRPASTPGSGGGGASTLSGGGVSWEGGSGADGIVVISYNTGTMYATGGTVTYTSTKTIHTFTQDGIFEIHDIYTGGLYYVSFEDTNGKIKLSAKYDPYSGTPLTHGTTGSITFSTVAVPGPAIAKSIEKYDTATTTEYRYYVLDNNGYTWVYDSGVYDYSLANFGVGTQWMLPDYTDYSGLDLTGMSVINGWIMTLSCKQMYGKPTVNLGTTALALTNAKFSNPFPTHINFAYTGTQGKMYYTDGNFIGELTPDNSLLTSVANIQSLAEYTASTTTGTISVLINGSLPYTQDANGATQRIPVVFFTDVYGTQPTNLSYGTVYWLEYNLNTETFEVFSTESSTTAINIATGAAGNQYLTTFWPDGTQAGINGTSQTVLFTQQRVNLPYNEVAQTMVEIGNTIIIGTESNKMFPWNQIDATPSDIIELPEANVKTMINVNNMVYIFAGNKGNIYITNGSVASFALKIPDYCAGVPGTPNSYIEPYFEWFDAMYLRGRVYCSILDQTATKAGNCGGIWSFVPTQNMSMYDVGMSLRLENQNSYGDYDGCARILIPNQEQNAIAPQYWAWWQDSYSIATSAFGVDYTATTPVTKYVVETDLMATGTLLSKNTYTQLEYKLSTPLTSTDAVQLFYRLNSTDAWTSCGTVRLETENPLSGYYEMPFQKTQWLQFRAECTTPGTSASSFIRLVQIRLR